MSVRKESKLDPDKVKTIHEILVLKRKKEILGFLGKLQFINRFIANLTAVCEPIFKLLRKNQPVK